MEQLNMFTEKPKGIVYSIFETLWAIGTSVAATGVLIY